MAWSSLGGGKPAEADLEGQLAPLGPTRIPLASALEGVTAIVQVSQGQQLTFENTSLPAND